MPAQNKRGQVDQDPGDLTPNVNEPQGRFPVIFKHLRTLWIYEPLLHMYHTVVN